MGPKCVPNDLNSFTEAGHNCLPSNTESFPVLLAEKERERRGGEQEKERERPWRTNAVKSQLDKLLDPLSPNGKSKRVVEVIIPSIPFMIFDEDDMDII